MTRFEQYVYLIHSNLRHNFLPHLALSLLFLLLAPILFGINSLDKAASAVPLEMFVSLIGILLLTPVFLPEEKAQLKDVIRSKCTGCLTVFTLRIFYSLTTMLLLILAFCLAMRFSGSQVSPLLMLGTLTNAAFLGTLGLFFAAVSKSTIVGYMVPCLYYLFNFAGPKILGPFYLFSMAQNSFREKIFLAAAAAVLLILTQLILLLRDRRE